MPESFNLPTQFGPREVPSWFAAWDRVKGTPDLQLVLKANSFLSPAGVSILAAAIADRADSGGQTSLNLEEGESSAARYLQRIDFFQQIGVQVIERFRRHNPEGRFVTLRRILDLKVARNLADEVRDFIEAQLPDAPPSVLRSIHFAVEELGANIVQHSGRPSTGFGLAQGFPKSRRIQISFADAGIGFLASLKRNPELEGRIDDDATAIQLAVEKGLSSIGGKSNMGIGLPVLRDLSDRLSADLWIASGDALWHRTTVAGHRVSIVSAISRWQGSWVCLDSPVSPVQN